jgi:uncharacterized protein (TIGR03067 family)
MTYFTTAIAGILIAASTLVQDPKAKPGASPLEGTWVITSINGQASPEGSPEMTLTFTGDKYHQAVGADVNERGTIKIDKTKKPMTIDLIISEGQDAGKTQLGIFEVAGDTLRANLDTPGAQQRPPDLTIKDGFIMFVGKKKKA